MVAARFLAGVDGGGSRTRARLWDADGRRLGEAEAGPSGLSQGIEQAWRHVRQAVDGAFAAASLKPAAPGDIALGLGLAGAEVESLRRAFLAADPGYAATGLAGDVVALLAGAFGEQAGAVVAAGTGSVAAAQDEGGRYRIIGGWGFPVGDEGSGAWLGLRAMQAALAALDRRAPTGPLADALRRHCGGDDEAVQAWCLRANQHAYAQLAPFVFAASEAGDAQAEALLQAAANELARLVGALQREAGAPLAVVVAGSIGRRLWSRWPAALRSRVVEPAGDACDGALALLRAALRRQGAAA